jgi:hypothetical protein
MESIQRIALVSEQIVTDYVKKREAPLVRSYDNRSPGFPEFDAEEDDGDIASGGKSGHTGRTHLSTLGW